jgi:hypothetical protein
MSIIKPIAGTHTAVTTSGASTANNVGVLGTGAIANSTNLDDGGNLVLVVGFGSAPAVGAAIACYLIPKIDGSNYPDLDTASSPPTATPAYYIGSFTVVKAQTAAQRLGLNVPFIGLSAKDFEVYLVNTTAQTMSAGWTLDFYGEQLQNI